MTDKFQNVTNFRDVGETVNKYLGKKLVREGILFRSGALDKATPKDYDYLHHIGIRAVLDLRSNTEQQRAAKKRAMRQGADVSSPNSIQGATYYDVQVTGRAFEKKLLSLLSWWQFFRVIFLYIFGYKVEAVRIIGKEAMIPRGLVGLAGDTIECSGLQINRALSVLSCEPTTPALVHCTHGKDRTGLICALVLMILDVPLDAIEHDYFLSDAVPAAVLRKRTRQVREIGLSDDWAGTASDMIQFISTTMAKDYGDLDCYLDLNGFDTRRRAEMRELLLY